MTQAADFAEGLSHGGTFRGECVTREHVCQYMSGIAHQGRTVVEHSRIIHVNPTPDEPELSTTRMLENGVVVTSGCW